MPRVAQRWQPAVERALDIFDFTDCTGPFRFFQFTTLQATVFVLHKAGGLTTREIAGMVGGAQTTVMDHLRAAEAKYRQPSATARRWAHFNALATVAETTRALNHVVDRLERAPSAGAAWRWAEFNRLIATDYPLFWIIERLMREPPSGIALERSHRGGRRPMRATIYELGCDEDGEARGFIESLHSAPPKKKRKHEERVGLDDKWIYSALGERRWGDREGARAGDEAISIPNLQVD